MSSSGSSTEATVPDFNAIEEETSGEEPPRSEWSSLELESFLPNRKKVLYSKGQYSPGSGEICAQSVAMSDSDVFTHVYYNYPAVLDPGITEAILSPEKPPTYEDNGQDLYMVVCKEMNSCPVRLFYRNLLNSEINLSYYCIDPQGVRAMAMALNYNKNVRKLTLTDNFLNDDACYHLGQMLNNNDTLEELDLAGCRIGVSGLKRLSATFYHNHTLRVLNLSRNCLGEEGGMSLANSIMFGMPVKKLYLRKNELGKGTAIALAEAFAFKDRLTHLDLSWNNFFNAPSTCKMLESLCSSIILTEINLSWNSLEGERVANAIKGLLSLETLTVLDISSNRLEGHSIEIIVSNLPSAKRLVTLDLSFNPMSDKDAFVALEQMLKRKVKLQNLLMTEVWVNKHFLLLLERVKGMKTRKNFTITYGGVYQNWTIEGPDARKVILRRADFLGNQNKKNKVDIPLFFMALAKESRKPYDTKQLLDRCDTEKIPLSADFINELSAVFPGPKSGKTKFINMQAIVEYIQRLWPEKKLPLTPPPEPEPAEPVEPDPLASPAPSAKPAKKGAKK